MPFITQDKTNLKYILIVIISAAIAGGGILGYYYLWIKELETRLVQLEIKLPEAKAPEEIPVEKEIANWETYKNEEYGFEIKYPPSFDFQESPTELIQDQIFIIVRFTQKDTVNYPIVDIALAKTIMTSEEWIESKNYCPDWFTSCSSLRAGPISESIQFDSLGRHYASIDTIFKDNGILFNIVLAATAPNAPISESAYLVYDQMLSTFRFIEPEEEFCGWSTEGSCASDSDCISGGCSDQVCQSKNEEPIITTCEYRDCYAAKDYGLECKCKDNKCQWSK